MPVSQEMAINVTGSSGPMSAIPGHEAHVSFRRTEKKKNISISHCPGAAMRSLETCTHIIPMPELCDPNFASKQPPPMLVVSVISVLVH